MNPKELEDFDHRLKDEDKATQTASKPNNPGKSILAAGWVDKDGVHFKDKAA